MAVSDPNVEPRVYLSGSVYSRQHSLISAQARIYIPHTGMKRHIPGVEGAVQVDRKLMCNGRERISGNGFAGIINGRSPIRKFFPKLCYLSVNKNIHEIVEEPLCSGLNTVRFSSQYGYVLLKAKITETLVKPMLFKLHFS